MHIICSILLCIASSDSVKGKAEESKLVLAGQTGWLISSYSNMRTPWRNGSASDSRSEGCVFESRRGHHRFCFNLSKTKIKYSKRR